MKRKPIRKDNSRSPKLQIIYVPIKELLPYKNNPRKHEHAIDKFREGLNEFGIRYPILVNKRDRIVIDGHLRIKAAASLGYKEMPVIYVDDWSPAKVKAFRMFVNKSASFANWDPELLAGEFDDLEPGLVEFTGFDSVEVEELQMSQELTDLRAKVDGSGTKRALGEKEKQIKVVLYVDDLQVVESALSATGEQNRGKALRILCEDYLDRRQKKAVGTKGKTGWDELGFSL